MDYDCSFAKIVTDDGGSYRILVGGRIIALAERSQKQNNEWVERIVSAMRSGSGDVGSADG